jgi:hypothetical protein
VGATTNMSAAKLSGSSLDKDSTWSHIALFVAWFQTGRCGIESQGICISIYSNVNSPFIKQCIPTKHLYLIGCFNDQWIWDGIVLVRRNLRRRVRACGFNYFSAVWEFNLSNNSHWDCQISGLVRHNWLRSWKSNDALTLIDRIRPTCDELHEQSKLEWIGIKPYYIHERK